MGETSSHQSVSCHQRKLPLPGLAYIKLSFWTKGPYENPQRTEAPAKTISCFPQTDRKAPLLKTATAQPVKMKTSI